MTKIFYGALAILCAFSTANAANFQTWSQDFQRRAIASGIPAAAVHKAFQGITLDEKVIALDRKQPEGHMTLTEYVERTVTPKRIATGQEKRRLYRTILSNVERNYGVPAEILVALWGKETDFGGYTGTNETISSLATLAYEGRRRQFFEQELLNAIQVMQYLGLSPRTMKGSWAGAVGQCQFMPSNYLKYGVDGNRNGRTDLWNELEDVFPSMANLLVHEGWKRGAGWGQRVKIPEGFDKNLIGRDKSPRDIHFWEQRGVRFNTSVPSSVTHSLRLYQPDGVNGPAYALYPNFDVLMRWNHSGYFAVAVGRLADRLSQSVSYQQ